MPDVNSGTVRVRGFKIDDLEVVLQDGATMTIDELRTKHNLPTERVTYLLNGAALPASTAGNTVVRAGDRVDIPKASKGGRG